MRTAMNATEDRTRTAAIPQAQKGMCIVRLCLSNNKMPTISVESPEGDASSDPRRMILYAAMAFVFLALAFGLYWRFVYCPGPLGHFDWFRCRCSENSDRVSQNSCTCEKWFNEKGARCEACGDVGLPCCDGGDHCKEAPFYATHYACVGGICTDQSKPVPF